MSSSDLKEKKLQTIIEDIFKLDSPKIDENRRSQISDFVISTVNGDNPVAHLALNVNLGENKRGVMVYILTNARLIKIDIGTEQNEIQSNSFFLNTITGIERKLIDNDRAQFTISFQNGAFGLKYSVADKNITDFFQKIDQPQPRMASE